MEQWKDIAGFGGRYRVSDLGRIYSVRFNRFRTKQPSKSDGYVRITIQGKVCYLHRLVAEAFIPNPKNKPEVNHKDLNKANCAASNLAWATHAENAQHATFWGLGNGHHPGQMRAVRQ